MKRIIAAVSLAVLATPVLAAEVAAPFEQTQFDRALPIILDRDADSASAGASGAKDDVWSGDHNFIAPAP